MKVISFFSAKGGTGKTTFNLLFASYLSYVKHLRVLFLDFDAPEYNAYFTRQRELTNQENTEEAFPLETVEIQTMEKLASLAKRLRSLENDLDYIIMDFGGSFSKEDAVCQLCLAGCLDLIVIPTELDSMIIASSKALATTLAEFGQQTLLFFNRVHGKEKSEMYEQLYQWFEQHEIKISHNRVRNSLAMRRDAESKASFMRSSICFPEKDIRNGNPGIIGLFDEVMDYEGTGNSRKHRP